MVEGGEFDSERLGMIEPEQRELESDLEANEADSAADIAAYFKQLEEKEKGAVSKLISNVVPIKTGLSGGADGEGAGFTDDELLPMTPADMLFERITFDPEEALRLAADEAWIIDDLIPAKGLAVIYGPPGSYKSFVALDLAASISSGKDWHGYECEMPGAVLYIAAEGSRGLMERAVAWKLYHQRELGPFAILTVPVMMDDAVMVQAFIECLERAAQQLGAPIRLVVIDTMARSFNGDENSAQEVGAFVNNCSRFASNAGDCTVMIIAHTGKDVTKGIRGSSALNGAADCHFLVTKPNIGQALVKNTKQKDVEEAEPMRFAMEHVSTGIVDRKGRIRRSLVPVLESKGEMADPDAEEEITAFDHRDSNALVGMVRAAEVAGKKISEDELRQEFITYIMADGNKKEAAARKTWQRTYKRVREAGGIMKAGANLYIPERK